MADSLLYPFCYLRIVMSITEIRRPEVTNSPKVGFVSLGCPKALVDSEQILTQLRAEGYETAKSYGSGHRQYLRIY